MGIIRRELKVYDKKKRINYEQKEKKIMRSAAECTKKQVYLIEINQKIT